MKKIDTIKIIGLVGSACGLASTIITGYTTQKNMEKIIEEKVKEAIENLSK